MAYGSSTTRARTPATSSATYSNPRNSTMHAGDDNPTCDHSQPMIRLECKNGNNKGRFFYKCAQEQDKCRKFIWEDQRGAGSQNHSQRAGSAMPSSSSQAAPRSSGPISGSGGGNVLGGRPSGSKAPPPQCSPSSSTEYTQSQPSTPSKRRRAELSPDQVEGDDDTIESASSNRASNRKPVSSTPPTWRGFQSRASAAPPSSSQQALEDAIDDNSFDDIIDFDDFEQGGTGQDSPSLKGKGKFVSFGNGPTTPKLGSGSNSKTAKLEPPSTPPSSRLGPGMPVTPTSITKAGGGSRWNEITTDPSSPFHARANALLNGGGGVPQSSSSSSILSSGDTASLLDGEVPHTPTTNKPPAAPQTPSEHLSSLSILADTFSDTLRKEMVSATKSAQSTERQLKAMKQKAAYHEKREKDVKEELENLKEKMRMLQAENAQLKAGIFAD